MRRIIQSTLFLVCLIWPFVGSAALRNGSIEILSLRGTVTLVDPQGNSIPATEGFVFQQGYKIMSGSDSVVELVFSNGSKFVLEPNTGIQISTFRQVQTGDGQGAGLRPFDRETTPSVMELQLLSGKITGLSSLLDPLSTATIRSIAGVVSVQGTRFNQEYGAIFTMELGVGQRNGSAQVIVECFRGVMEANVFGQFGGPISIPARRKLVAVVIGSAPGTSSDKTRQGGGGTNGSEVFLGDVSTASYLLVGAYALGPLGFGPRPLVLFGSNSNGTGSGSTSDIIQQVLDNINKVVEKQQINPSPTGG